MKRTSRCQQCGLELKHIVAKCSECNKIICIPCLSAFLSNYPIKGIDNKEHVFWRVCPDCAVVIHNIESDRYIAEHPEIYKIERGVSR